MGLLEALSMGIVAGFTPSAHSLFLAYVSTQGRSRALGAWLAGILGDAVIILLTGTLVTHLPAHAQAGLQIAGLLLIAMMGYKIFLAPASAPLSRQEPRETSVFLSALGIQLLNPYPYIFWAGVFFPRAQQLSVLAAISAALLFLGIVHAMKWLLYAQLVQAISPRMRRLAVKGAYALFALIYVSKFR